MNILPNYSKAAWLPLMLVVAWMSLNTSSASAQEIQWRQDLAKAKAEARDTNRLVWLHFTADWCVPCKRLDSFVFSSTNVIRAADRNTVAVKIDADAQESLVKQLDVPRIPYDVIMTPSGRVILERSSSKDSAGFLKMLNSLDTPLQALNEGDREVIDARIDKIRSVMKRTEGLNQKKSDLDLDSPSHEMASTTVQGQRLERGFESVKRESEIQAVKAKLLKKKAELYIVEQEKQAEAAQAPKFSENPFFKKPASASKATPTNSTSFSGSQSSGFASEPKFVSNSFVKQSKTIQQQAIKAGSGFVPPVPPMFGKKAAEKGCG